MSTSKTDQRVLWMCRRVMFGFQCTSIPYIMLFLYIVRVIFFFEYGMHGRWHQRRIRIQYKGPWDTEWMYTFRILHFSIVRVNASETNITAKANEHGNKFACDIISAGPRTNFTTAATECNGICCVWLCNVVFARMINAASETSITNCVPTKCVQLHTIIKWTGLRCTRAIN